MKSLHLALGALITASLSLFTAAPAAAQSPLPTLKQETPGLAAKARIPADSATRVAQRAVSGGQVAARELEMEGGKLIYSFDMTVAGKPGIDEVNVDARTGTVLGVHHETPASEARERRSDAGKSKMKGHPHDND